jgi:hypothetical protein
MHILIQLKGQFDNVSVPGPAPHTRVAFGRFLTQGRAHGPTFSGKLTPSQKPGLKEGGKLSIICWSWPPPTSEVGLNSLTTLDTYTPSP